MGKQLEGIEIKKLRAGDEKAIRRWFEEYADPLYTVVFYRVGGDGDLAGDIVQETFLTALKKIEDYEPGRGSMFAWLGWLSKNCIKKALRERSRYVSYQADELRVDGELLEVYGRIAKEPLPADVLERAETAELVRLALGSIPAGYRSVLRRYYYEQDTIQEISRSRGVSAGAVRASLHRARAAFKREFLSLARSAGERK